MRIAIVGDGKMGRAVEACAAAAGHEVACILGSEENPDGAGVTAQAMAGVDVAIEFTAPDAAVANIDRLTELGVPAVVGTTGWYDRLDDVRRMVEERRAALVWAANFAPGVNLLIRLAAETGRLFAGQKSFDACILEMHHREKRDAPSGTALRLRSAARARDPDRGYPISSVRTGHVPGAHRLIYDSPDETLILEHQVRDRRVFAVGALQAAEWIVGRTGCFEFSSVLFGDPSDT